MDKETNRSHDQVIENSLNKAVAYFQIVFGEQYMVEATRLSPTQVTFKFAETTGDWCVTLQYRHHAGKRSIHVTGIRKCHNLSGEEVLAKVLQIAKTPWFHIDEITLVDMSEIDPCDVSLAHLKILTTGQSWYNKFGFFSKDAAAEYKENAVIRNMTLRQLFDSFLQKEPVRAQMLMNDDIFAKHHAKKVKRVALEMEKIVKAATEKSQCDDWYIEFLKLVVDCDVLAYNSSLTCIV